VSARPRRRRLWYALAAILVVLLAVGIPAGRYLLRDKGLTYTNVVEQYKYGSVGTEAEQGVPYYIWAVLPDVFPDLLPKAPGRGYERFGFIFETGRNRPIGLTWREKPVPLVGLNCALCHTSTFRGSPSAPRRLVLGMPANRLRVGDYIRFLRSVGRDDRFDSAHILPAIDRRFPGKLGRLDRLFYRLAVIPQMRKGLHQVDDSFAWMDVRPDYGPGRVDTFSPWKDHFDFDMSKDSTIGTADFPSIWNQKVRRGMALHWDGNNPSLTERNISASLAVGATKDSLDFDQLNRVAQWLLTLQPPRYPPSRIDRSLAALGKPLYERSCAACHDVGGARVGKVTPIGEVGTDPGRLNSFTAALVPKMNSLGKGKSWRFRHFRKTSGYTNSPLDGIWLRAPYLHNGSVPTLRALLFPGERPSVFYTGYDVYDWERVGFVAQGAAARREGFRFDTGKPGNSNRGHVYGAELSARDREAILEYLKTK
jgi:hypothetical protein